MIKAKGEEYVKQLRSLDIKMHMISGGAMHELMAAGEMPMSLRFFATTCSRQSRRARRPSG